MIDHDELARLTTEHLHRRADSLAPAAGSPAAARRRARVRTQRRLVGAGAVGVAAVALGGAAWTGRDGRPGSIAPATTDTTSTSTSTTATATTAPGTTLAAVDLRRGDTGEAVRALQQALADRGYDPGAIDGAFGEQTEQAVWAYEGLEMGREWADQTGVVDETFRLQFAGSPALPAPRRSLAANHTEIFLDTQVLVAFHGPTPVLITHISSGDGTQWCSSVSADVDELGNPLPSSPAKDVCGVSITPPGVFQFYRRAEHLYRSSLGETNNPVFFNYGIAVGGAVHVPKGPASHGIVRIPMAISQYFPSLVADGDPVYVFDGITEPEDVPRAQTLPVFPFPDPSATTP